MADKYNDNTAQLVKKRYDLSREYCQPYFDRFLDNYKHYFLRIIDEAVEEDPESYPFYSQLMIPINYQIIETILPRMFSRPPTNFSIRTDEENDELSEVKFAELIKYQIQHPYLIDDPVFLRLATALKEEFITGNAWGEVPWVYKEAEVLERQPYSSIMGITEPSWDNLEKINAFKLPSGKGIRPEWKLVKVKKKVMDAPVFVHRSIFHTFPDPKKKRVSDLRYAITEDWMTKDEIMDMVKQSPGDYKNIDEFKRMHAMREQGEKSGNNYDEELAGIFGSSDYSTKDDSKDQGQFKVWTMRTPERLSVVINEKLTIRDGDNPNGDGKIGLILMKDIPIPHELFAWGEPDPIKRIEDSMSDQSNMRNDAVLHELLRMWKLDPTALVDGEEFIPEPGTVVQMKDLNGLAEIQRTATPVSAYREYNEWDKIIQNVSGVSDYTTGQADPSMTKVGVGIQLLQQAANARFSFKLQLFEQLGLKAMGTMYVQRNLQFFDEPVSVRTSSHGKLKVTPEDILELKGIAHFIVDTGATVAVNKTAEFNKWKIIADYISANKPPFDNLVQESKDKVAKRMLYALEANDADDLVKRQPVVMTPQINNSTLTAGVTGTEENIPEQTQGEEEQNNVEEGTEQV